MTRVKISAALFIFLLCALFSNNLFAQVKVYYAGIAYMGGPAAKETLYKYSSRLIDNNEILYHKVLRERLESLDNDNIELLIGEQISDHKDGDALSMVFAVEYEDVSVAHLAGKYKIDIDLRVNILIFDFSEMVIVSSYPIAIQLRDASDHKPTENELMDKVRSLYLGNSELNIFDEFVKRLSILEIKRHYANTIKVRNVVILDKALPSIPNGSEVKMFYETYLAQMFSSYLSKNQNVSVLPYTDKENGNAAGNAISHKLPIILAEKTIALTIPEETYAIDIVLRKLTKTKIGNNKYKSVWGYASYFNIKLSIPGETDMFTDAKFRGLVKQTILVGQSHTVDDWSLHKESMNRLFDELTKNISARDSDWLKSVTITENVVAQLGIFDEKVRSCQ